MESSAALIRAAAARILSWSMLRGRPGGRRTTGRRLFATARVISSNNNTGLELSNVYTFFDTSPEMSKHAKSSRDAGGPTTRVGVLIVGGLRQGALPRRPPQHSSSALGAGARVVAIKTPTQAGQRQIFESIANAQALHLPPQTLGAIAKTCRRDVRRGIGMRNKVRLESSLEPHPTSAPPSRCAQAFGGGCG